MLQTTVLGIKFLQFFSDFIPSPHTAIFHLIGCVSSAAQQRAATDLRRSQPAGGERGSGFSGRGCPKPLPDLPRPAAASRDPFSQTEIN